MNIATLIKYYCEDHNISISDFGKKIGVSKQSVSNWMSYNFVNTSRYYAICRILQLNPIPFDIADIQNILEKEDVCLFNNISPDNLKELASTQIDFPSNTLKDITFKECLLLCNILNVDTFEVFEDKFEEKIKSKKEKDILSTSQVRALQTVFGKSNISNETFKNSVYKIENRQAANTITLDNLYKICSYLSTPTAYIDYRTEEERRIYKKYLGACYFLRIDPLGIFLTLKEQEDIGLEFLLTWHKLDLPIFYMFPETTIDDDGIYHDVYPLDKIIDEHIERGNFSQIYETFKDILDKHVSSGDFSFSKEKYDSMGITSHNTKEFRDRTYYEEIYENETREEYEAEYHPKKSLDVGINAIFYRSKSYQSFLLFFEILDSLYKKIFWDIEEPEFKHLSVQVSDSAIQLYENKETYITLHEKDIKGILPYSIQNNNKYRFILTFDIAHSKLIKQFITPSNNEDNFTVHICIWGGCTKFPLS